MPPRHPPPNIHRLKPRHPGVMALEAGPWAVTGPDELRAAVLGRAAELGRVPGKKGKTHGWASLCPVCSHGQSPHRPRQHLLPLPSPDLGETSFCCLSHWSVLCCGSRSPWLSVRSSSPSPAAWPGTRGTVHRQGPDQVVPPHPASACPSRVWVDTRGQALDSVASSGIPHSVRVNHGLNTRRWKGTGDKGARGVACTRGQGVGLCVSLSRCDLGQVPPTPDSAVLAEYRDQTLRSCAPAPTF